MVERSIARENVVRLVSFCSPVMRVMFHVACFHKERVA